MSTYYAPATVLCSNMHYFLSPVPAAFAAKASILCPYIPLPYSCKQLSPCAVYPAASTMAAVCWGTVFKLLEPFCFPAQRADVPGTWLVTNQCKGQAPQLPVSPLLSPVLPSMAFCLLLKHACFPSLPSPIQLLKQFSLGTLPKKPHSQESLFQGWLFWGPHT